MAKYNSKIANEICSNIEGGMSQKDSAILAGISEDTFYAWRKEKSEFSESVERAILRYKQCLVSKVNSYAFKDGRLALEVLSRKWPHEYGRREVLAVPKDDQSQKIMTEETVKILIGVYERWLEASKREKEYESQRIHSGVSP
jgi:hypothetical protein